MAYIQHITPPPNKILNFSIQDFSGGLNNRSDQLLDEECSDVANMVFADDVIMEKRKGQTYYDETSITGPITFIDYFRPYAGVDEIFKASDTELFKLDVKITNLAGRMSGMNHDGKYFIADGSKLYVYGKFAQTTTTYEKVIGTAINANVLLEVVSPADGHTRLGTEHVKGILNIDYTDYKIFYEPCELEFLDTYKGANKVPEGTKYIASHNGRLFISGADKDDDNVFISDIRNPYYYGVSLPMQLPPNSDKISGLTVYDDAVVVGRKYDLYTITGNTNRPDTGTEAFRLKKLNSHCGFANNNAIDVAHNYLFFLGSDGNVYSLGGVRIDEKTLATSVISKQLDFFKAPIGADRVADLQNANSVFFEDNWYLSIGSKVLIYSYRHMAWTLQKNMNVSFFTRKDEQLFWGRYDGKLAKFGEDYYDFGNPFNAYWLSKSYDMESANNYKQYREFFLVAHTFSDFFSDIVATFYIDYEEVDEYSSIEDQKSIWGKLKWGQRFIRDNIIISLPFTIGRRGRNIKIKLSSCWDVTEIVSDEASVYNYVKKINTLLKTADEGRYFLYRDNEWQEIDYADLNQTMKIYQLNGDYEMRGKR